MKNKKIYSKPYRIFQITLFIGIIFAYTIFLIAGSDTPLGGVLPVEMVHFVVLLLLVMQVQTLMDIYQKHNKWTDVIFSMMTTLLAAFLAVWFYLENVHVAFTVVLGFIAFSMALNVARGIAQLNKKDTE
ncbi:hypothetical protein [Evansella tamaricis]|uniref:Uncharacterized protein n=1 Tax=Evansella tamaricis TaxID=2069301 RepID=A0ABS6JAK7_9BACI|nr:hypothetical protein [Evansella tamaricis]MBU9710716.1 hypothetical protein [Evansella tamaricis]